MKVDTSPYSWLRERGKMQVVAVVIKGRKILIRINAVEPWWRESALWVVWCWCFEEVGRGVQVQAWKLKQIEVAAQCLFWRLLSPRIGSRSCTAPHREWKRSRGWLAGLLKTMGTDGTKVGSGLGMDGTTLSFYFTLLYFTLLYSYFTRTSLSKVWHGQARGWRPGKP